MDYFAKDGAIQLFEAEQNTMLAVTVGKRSVQIILSWDEIIALHKKIGEFILDNRHLPPADVGFTELSQFADDFDQLAESG